MPECSGIALGIDRLLMVVQNQMKLEKVVSFTARVSRWIKTEKPFLVVKCIKIA